MKKIGVANNRNLYYLTIPLENENLENLLNTNLSNFMYLILTSGISHKHALEMANMCIVNKPLFVHCCGSNAQVFEDSIHDAIVKHALAFERSTGKEFDYDAVPQTSSDKELKSAVIFSAIGAFHENFPIENILIIDFENNANTKEQILAAVESI